MFENINDVHIIGSAKELNTMISSVDQRVQEMSNLTEQIKAFVANCGSTTFGQQYEKAVNAVSELSNTLYNKSIELNQSQRDLVNYIDRVDRFNDRPPSALPPRNHQVTRIKVSVNTRDDRFTKETIQKVIRMLNSYCDNISKQKAQLINEKSNIGSKWKDSQYRVYSSFIEEICRAIESGTRTLREYADYLQSKINNM